MAIYPVVAGQKPSQRNMIPPRASSDQLSRTTSAQNRNDLVDLSQSHEPSSISETLENPVVDTTTEKSGSKHSNNIQELLEVTGQKSEGPLIDFTGDMKKELPKDGQT